MCLLTSKTLTTVGDDPPAESRLQRAGWYAAFGLIPFGSSLPGLLILLADYIRGLCNRSRDLYPRLTPPLARWANRLMLAFLFSILLSSAFSTMPVLSFAADIGFFLIIIGLFWGAIDLGRLGPEHLCHHYLPLTVHAGAAACVIGLIRFGVVRLILHDENFRAVNLFTGCNAFGTTLILVGGLGLAYLIWRGGRWKRLAPPFLGLVCFTLLWTGSRGAWLGFSGMLAALCLFRRKLLLILLVVLMITGLFLLISPPLRERFLSLNQDGFRVSIWRSSLNLIRDNPILGVGTGVYPLVIKRYAVGVASKRESISFAHNIFLEAWAEFGLVGLITFTAFLLTIFFLSFALARTGNPLYQGIFAMLLGIVLHQQFDGTILSFGFGGAFWILLGLVIGFYAYEFTKRSSQTPKNETA